MPLPFCSVSNSNRDPDTFGRRYVVMDVSESPFSEALCTFETGGLVREEVTTPQPVVNGMSLATDAFMARKQPWLRWGYIDPTGYPFYADPTGVADSTAALIAALEYGRKNYLVVRLPASSQFLISDTIEITQGAYRRASAATVSDGIASGIVMVGAQGGTKPKIFLANSTSGFTTSGSPKSMIHFWGIGGNTTLTEDEAALYNAGIENIRVNTGTNAGAIAVEIRGAQGCFIHDCYLDATGGLACQQGLVGSGSSIVNTDYKGGSYGLRGTGVSRRPVPVFAGCRFEDQSVTAMKFQNDDAETISITGVSIKMATSASGPAVELTSASANTGYAVLTDCTIEFKTSSSANIAIESNISVKLLNVWTKGCGDTLNQTTGTTNDIDAETPITNWTWCQDATICIQPPTKALASGNVQFEMVRWADGSRVGYTKTVTLGTAASTPPTDLISRHHWGSEMLFPDSPGVVNAKLAAKDLGHTLYGDGDADDYAALQAVINAHDKIFLPRGYYNTSKTLVLQDNTALIGVNRYSTVIIPRAIGGGDFTVVTAGNYAVETSSSADSKTILSNLSIWAPQSEGGTAGLKWQCGDRSMYRTVNVGQFNINGFIGDGVRKRLPVMVITGANAGGRFWGMSEILILTTASATYAMLKIENTVLPIRIYGANLEHANEGKCVIWIENCDNVTLFGNKLESDHGTGTESPQIIVDDSTNFGLLGFGGIFEAAADDATTSPPASVEINLCNNYTVALIIDRLNDTLDHLNTIAVTEQVTSGVYVHTPKLDRPAEYKRGTFDWTNYDIPRVS